MADGAEVQVVGLREFRSAIRKLDNPAGFQTELKDAHFAVAEMVRRRAAAIGAARGVPKHVVGTLVSRRQQAAAKIAIGSNSAPDALGWEFGAQHNVARTGPSGRRFLGHNQFPFPARSNTGTGFLYPAIRETKPLVERLYIDAIDRISKDAFPD